MFAQAHTPIYTHAHTHISVYNLSFVSVYFQLTPVNTVAFTVQAKDADDDTLVYSIDQASVSTTFKLLEYMNKPQASPY